MKRLFCLLLTTLSLLADLQAQSTKFTYQGRLKYGADFASGFYDLQFSVWDASSTGNQLGSSITNVATLATNGLFTVTLDFGSVFDGSSRWIEIGVRTNGGGAFSTLTPRQELTAAPYAIHANGVNATDITGAITANMLAPDAAAANLAASGQSGVPGGAMILSANPDATNLTAAGYVKVGGQLDLSAWRQRASLQDTTARRRPTAVWTGSELIIWGGFINNYPGFGTGAKYSPTLNQWSPVSSIASPSRRQYYSATWTGERMCIWGGFPDGSPQACNDGGLYNPQSDSWAILATTNAPSPRASHSAVWTGTELLIWGGAASGNVMCNTGAKYNPISDSWTTISTNTPLSPRALHSAVWTGKEMIIWGGITSASEECVDGARYDPITDSWALISTNGVPVGRYGQCTIWSGTEMIVWGGAHIFGGTLRNGGRYNPATDTWSPISCQFAGKTSQGVAGENRPFLR